MEQILLGLPEKIAACTKFENQQTRVGVLSRACGRVELRPDPCGTEQPGGPFCQKVVRICFRVRLHLSPNCNPSTPHRTTQAGSGPML